MGSGNGVPPFQVEEVQVRNGDLVRSALVFTSNRPLVFGRQRLLELHGATEVNAVDRWILERFEERRGAVHIAILRAMNRAGERVWSVDPALSSREREDLGYVLTRALLPLHRRLLARGVSLMVHSDWGLVESQTMQAGVQRMIDVLRRQPRAHPGVQEVDMWILKNLLFHLDMPLDRIIASVLPDHLRLIEMRGSRLRDLIGRLPTAAVD